MADSMSEMLRADMECEGLLECFHDLKALDREIFEVLCERGESLTVDEIADEVGRERSTAYRSVQRLLQAGFIRKEQVNYEQGGYYHVYEPRDGEEIAQELQRTLNDWYAKMGTLIGEFEQKYGETPERAPAED
ncbi:transcriptional regulator [Halarchaeum grantii]|uniref:Transcriptional regulator n=1 Tax=Halarchaeum grantii TaxID=1193105 RepID=A0A830F604_9EURY|nr:helix-turn-helix domain-containing protein [Halarchaeum grantii]GGL22909.1 transcriptional regulator [Halarchaeum grantii]